MSTQDAYPTFCEDNGITLQDIDRSIDRSSTLLAPIIGHTAEVKFEDFYLTPNPDITCVSSVNEHDTSVPGDFTFEYKGKYPNIEIKYASSKLETFQNPQQTFDLSAEPITHVARYNMKGSSDIREVEYEDQKYPTTLLNADETDIDIIGICLKEYYDQYDLSKVNPWQFAFINVSDLPRSTSKDFPVGLQRKLVPSHPKIHLPVRSPYTLDFEDALNQLD